LVPSIHRALREAEERAERKRAEDALRFLAEASAIWPRRSITTRRWPAWHGWPFRAWAILHH
jgi:hypothetical protein